MKNILFYILFLVFAVGCAKEKHPDSICINGTVRWGGDIGADGLGWHITDSVGGLKFYFPRNLPEGLKTDGLSVYVCMYETDEKFYCQCASFPNKHHITSIKKN
jgi:hypothetical protein